MSDPEAMFALLGPLLSRQERDRWKSLASMRKRRTELHSEVGFGSFDGRFVRDVKGGDAFPRPLLAELRRLGAGDTCTVISWAEPWEAALQPTLEDLVMKGRVVNDEGDSADDVILVCLPGRLAYFQTHDLVHQVIYRPS